MVGRGGADEGVLSGAGLVLRVLRVLRVGLSSGARVRSIAEETRMSFDGISSSSSSSSTPDESYILKISINGKEATLEANTTLGLLRGLTTFGQMWYEWKGVKYLLEVPVQVVDKPAFVSDLCFSMRVCDEGWEWEAV